MILKAFGGSKTISGTFPGSNQFNGVLLITRSWNRDSFEIGKHILTYRNAHK